MRPENPKAENIPALRRLWAEVFGDGEEFLDLFFRTGFHPRRCLWIPEGKEAAAALYWLDLHCDGARFAYIYAVATGKKYRGRGLCRALMEKAHAVLSSGGYAGAVLVPEGQSLAAMYAKMGYAPCCGIREFPCKAGSPVPLRKLTCREYQSLRRSLLPDGGLELGEEALAFLAGSAEFFAGEDCLLAAVREGERLTAAELLGDEKAAPGITAALGCREGVFRVPGNERPFAMAIAFREDAPRITHLGFAFD